MLQAGGGQGSSACVLSLSPSLCLCVCVCFPKVVYVYVCPVEILGMLGMLGMLIMSWYKRETEEASRGQRLLGPGEGGYKHTYVR